MTWLDLKFLWGVGNENGNVGSNTDASDWFKVVTAGFSRLSGVLPVWLGWIISSAAQLHDAGQQCGKTGRGWIATWFTARLQSHQFGLLTPPLSSPSTPHLGKWQLVVDDVWRQWTWPRPMCAFLTTTTLAVFRPFRPFCHLSPDLRPLSPSYGLSVSFAVMSWFRKS